MKPRIQPFESSIVPRARGPQGQYHSPLDLNGIERITIEPLPVFSITGQWEPPLLETALSLTELAGQTMDTTTD